MITAERRRKNIEKEEEANKIEINKRTNTEILLEILAENTCRKPGWHRRDLMLNPKVQSSSSSQVYSFFTMELSMLKR